MKQSSREIVKKCLTFDTPERMPRTIWILPWFDNNYPGVMEKLENEYPTDFACAPSVYNPSPKMKGNAFEVGDFIDEWGCKFTNIHKGVIGEVKEPLINDINNIDEVEPPYDTLPDDYESARKTVNNFCANTDKFVVATCCPRPWERFQFIRGTEEAMMDLALNKEETKSALEKIHAFYMKELELWVSTDVDAITFMDDWGSQNNLLISPRMWKSFFKPLYKDYCDLAHANNKFTFMHSDGNIEKIYSDLIEIGVDAVNSQLFCMNMEEIAKIAKGKITFWGEIDRQHVIPSENLQVGRDAVRKVAKHLYDPKGGIIAQFELGPGANPEIAFTIMDEWNKIQGI